MTRSDTMTVDVTVEPPVPGQALILQARFFYRAVVVFAIVSATLFLWCAL